MASLSGHPARGARRLRRAGGSALVMIAVTIVLVLVVPALRGGDRPSVTDGPPVVGPDPLVFDPSETAIYERAAAFGLSHVLYAKSPGGVIAAARRTARFRPLIEAAVSGSGLDPDIVEAIVLLESAGRPDVIAGGDPENAAGLTQILAETATDFLGMRVELAKSRTLTRRIESAQSRGDEGAVKRLLAARRRIDTRFDPAQALAATVRYLVAARRQFGRDDLAVVSYHMGIGNLSDVLRDYAGTPAGPLPTIVRDRDLTWARVYFDSSPIRHRAAWRRLSAFGDDSQTYYWRVLAAREIMRLYRRDPTALERLARMHGRGPSDEFVLHPPEVTDRFATPNDLRKALEKRVLLPLPNDPMQLHFRLAAAVAPRDGDPAPYRTLRPAALRLLIYLAAEVEALSGAQTPLIVDRASYDAAYGRELVAQRLESAYHSPLHATGYAFDVARRYASGAQASAFQYTLERLATLGLISWTRDVRVIHVTVAVQAGALKTGGRR